MFKKFKLYDFSRANQDLESKPMVAANSFDQTSSNFIPDGAITELNYTNELTELEVTKMDIDAWQAIE
jgi:hypothetical protein